MKRTVLVQQKIGNGDKAPAKLRLNPVYITGVATQLQDDDISKVYSIVEVIYDLLKIYGYGNKSKFHSTPDMEIEHKKTTAGNKLKLVERFSQFVKKAGYGSWKDLFKYKINAFFSFHNGQEIPPMPQGLEEFPDLADPGFLAYGRAKRFIGILKLETEKFRSFALSLALGGKKGAPPVHDATIAAAEMKTFLHLTSEHADIPDFEIKDEAGFVFPINRETTCYQLRRTVREIFGSYKNKKGELKKAALRRSDLVKPCSPSWSAQYHMSRDEMGAVGSFLNLDSVREAAGQSFVDMKLEGVFLSGKLSEVYGPAGLIDQQKIDEEVNENHFFKETLGVGYDVTRLNELWDTKIYPNLLEQAMMEPPNTVVIGLSEPLKVRNITAGPPITYTALKPMQKWLFKKLRKNSVFQLIGTPVTEDIVAKQLGVLGEDEEFISGDYQASTDNLHSWVSETLLDELFIILRENNEEENEGGTPLEWLNNLEVLMKRALTGHRILDPSRMLWYRKKCDLPASWFKDQKEGQLMGSVISFPFLCMANAALCRWAMEISSGKNFRVVDRPIFGYELAPLLVNGDDCVKKGKTGVLFPTWKGVTAFGGLKSSVGKTFNAKEFLQINSEQFEYQVPGWEQLSGMRSEAIYKKLKYVNLGLVYAQKKDGRRGKCFAQLGSLHRDLERTCPAGLFKEASKLFIKEAMKIRYAALTKKIYRNPVNGDFYMTPKTVNVFKDGILCVSRIPFSSLGDANIPYFLPSWLGGLGLVPFAEGHISDYERAVGSFLRSNMGYSQDFTLRPFTERAKCQTHQLVAEALQDYKFLDGQSHDSVSLDNSGRAVRSLQDQYETLYGALCIDQLLKNPTRLVEVISRKEIYEDFYANCFQIRKVLRRARNALKDPVVYARHHATRLTDDELKSEKKMFTLSCYNKTPVKGAL